MSPSISSSVVPLFGLRVLVAAPDLAVLVLRSAALASAGARVHAASTREGALAELRRNPALDAAVLELGLPGGTLALEAALRTADPPVLSLVVGVVEPGLAAELSALGIVGHLAPPALPHALVPAVLRAAEATGSRRALPDAGWEAGRGQPTVGVDEAVSSLARRRGLTTRERTVLRYIALGYRYEDIGSRMSIATRTVKMYADRLRRKTGTATRRELLREVFGR